ncbi:MAG: D-alanyl-D-alanine carboxypeptidase [bacterium]
MWKLKLFREFILHFRKIDFPRRLLAMSYLLLAICYPGQNALQRLVIHPGTVRTYLLPHSSPVFYPQSDGTKVPPVSARAVIVQDVVSHTLMYTKSPDTLLLPASTTKIMTALVALSTWPDLATVITVKNEDRAIGQTIELQKGEQLTLKNMLNGLLVHSGNDAALAIADNFPGGYNSFVQAMNEQAKSLHLDHTVFKNPSGVEQYGHVTTARDLAILAGVAMENSLIRDIVSTRSLTITDTSGEITHHLVTTNELLGVLPGLKGLKTGWTENAGECLVSYVEREGHPLIVVVLGSLDRFGDTTALVNWAYAHHNWITPKL